LKADPKDCLCHKIKIEFKLKNSNQNQNLRQDLANWGPKAAESAAEIEITNNQD